MIGSSTTTNGSSSSMEFDPVYHLSVFQTEVSQSCSMSLVQSHVYNLLNGSSADFVNYISIYVSNRRGSDFVGMWAMYTEWRDMCVSPTSSQVRQLSSIHGKDLCYLAVCVQTLLKFKKDTVNYIS